jgi:hypothetical protein
MPPSQIASIPPLDQPAVVIRRDIRTAADRKFKGHIVLNMHMNGQDQTTTMGVNFSLTEHQMPVPGKKWARVSISVDDVQLTGLPIASQPFGMSNGKRNFGLNVDDRNRGSHFSVGNKAIPKTQFKMPEISPYPTGAVQPGQDWPLLASSSPTVIPLFQSLLGGIRLQYLGEQLVGHTPCYHMQVSQEEDMGALMKQVTQSMATMEASMASTHRRGQAEAARQEMAQALQSMPQIAGKETGISDVCINAADGDLQSATFSGCALCSMDVGGAGKFQVRVVVSGEVTRQ